MVNELPFEINNAEVAAALGVEISTLPDFNKPVSEPVKREAIPPVPPLSDDEWRVVSEALPKLPVPKPGVDYDDRKFLNAVCWYITAKSRGFGWGKLPEELGPKSSREHRHFRWCMLEYWRSVADALKDDERLSAARRRMFEQIADDAERRRIRVIEGRQRLTGAC